MLITSNPISAEANWDDYLHVNDDGKHEIRIESYQWYFIAYDLVQVKDLMNEGMIEEQAMEKSSYKDRVGRFHKNTEVILIAVSHDVQHGFTINELDVILVLDRVVGDEEFGPVAETQFTTPSTDITYTAYCHIYCGIGHPYEKINFIFGEGSTDYGRLLFAGMITINVGIMGITGYKIVKKEDRET